MPKSHRPKPLYQRGHYRLDRRPDRANLVITRYDPVRKRERLSSAGTSDVEVAKRALDALYLAETQGENTCPTCGQPIVKAGSAYLTSAIADYMVAQSQVVGSPDTIRFRLSHIVRYVETLREIPTCDQIDEAWVQRFRAWAIKQPIISSAGNARARSLSTVESSVRQLAAAINWAYGAGQTLKRARFKPASTTSMGGTPMYRADVADLIEMFRYASDPRMEGRRRNLLRFLRISVATWARPDAAHDVSTLPERKQWNSKYRVLNLNPAGRRQTKKFRPTVPVVHHVADELDTINGNYIPVNSVKSAFEQMALDLKLPAGGQSGMKLIRRSIANIVRARLEPHQWVEVEIFLGHRTFDATSDLYAPFSPDYLGNALKVVESVCDEIQFAVPNAFYRTFTAPRVPLRVVGGSNNG
jgi:hypothetical protein